MIFWYGLSGFKAKGEGVQVTWDKPEELEAYIQKVQSAANRLTSENRRLRKCHLTVADKVVLHQLLNIFSVGHSIVTQVTLFGS